MIKIHKFLQFNNLKKKVKRYVFITKNNEILIIFWRFLNTMHETKTKKLKSLQY